MKSVRFGIRFDEKTLKIANEKAEEMGISVSAYITLLIRKAEVKVVLMDEEKI